MAAGAGSAASATGLPHAECEGEVRDFVGSRPGMQDGKNGYAWFNSPQGLCVDPRNEDVYVADTNNHRIRVAHIDGTVETVLGNDNSRDSGGEFNSPKSIALWIPPGHEDDSDAHTAPVLYVGEGGGSNPLLFRVTCSGTRSGRRTWSKEAVAGQGETIVTSFTEPAVSCAHPGELRPQNTTSETEAKETDEEYAKVKAEHESKVAAHEAEKARILKERNNFNAQVRNRDTALRTMRTVGHNDDAPGKNVTFKTFRHMSVYKNLLFIADYRRVRVMNIGDWSSDSYHFVVTVVGREACNTTGIDSNGPDGSGSAFDHATLYPAVGGSGINIGEVGGVCADTKGGLIVADYNRHCLIHVDKVVDADGKLLADAGSRKARVIAGQWRSGGNKNGYGDVARFSHPQHLTMSEDGEFLYVADYGNSLIRRVDMGGDGGRLYGCTNLERDTDNKIGSPQALTGSVNGRRLYVADTGSDKSGTSNNRIRVVIATLRPQVPPVEDTFRRQLASFDTFADTKRVEAGKWPLRMQLQFTAPTGGTTVVTTTTSVLLARLPFARTAAGRVFGASADTSKPVVIDHVLTQGEFRCIELWCHNVSDIGLSTATVVGVLAFASKHSDTDHLASLCEEYIHRSMTADTVLPFLISATRFLNVDRNERVESVQRTCTRFAAAHYKDVISRPSSATALCQLVAQDEVLFVKLSKRAAGSPGVDYHEVPPRLERATSSVVKP